MAEPSRPTPLFVGPWLTFIFFLPRRSVVHYYIRRVPRIIRLLIDSLLRMYTRSVLAYFIMAANGVVLGTVGPVCVCVSKRPEGGKIRKEKWEASI
jgi:hypothetical protein